MAGAVVKPMSCAKNTYDKRGAIAAMMAAMRRRRNRPKQLRKYYCKACQGWHLTHQEKR